MESVEGFFGTSSIARNICLDRVKLPRGSMLLSRRETNKSPVKKLI